MAVFSLFKRKRFTKLEERLLREVSTSLPPSSAAIFQAQIEDIRRARRFIGGSREVLFYRNKGHEASPPFAANHAELKFAMIRFKVAGIQECWTANFWLVSGRFFSIDFSQNPRAIESSSAIEVTDFRLLHDPSKAVDLSVDMQPLARSEMNLPAWITDIEKHFHVCDGYKPLSPEKRSQLLREISCSLPDDYLALLECSEGLSVGPIGILGLSQVYEVVMPDWNYCLIAEIPKRGMLGVRTKGTDKEIWCLDYDGAAPWRKMGSSIEDAVRKLLSESQDCSTPE
jgi:hypothetical protein